LTPVVVASLLPDFTSLTANCEKPVVGARDEDECT
jgi:hypothetical protein